MKVKLGGIERLINTNGQNRILIVLANVILENVLYALLKPRMNVDQPSGKLRMDSTDGGTMSSLKPFQCCYAGCLRNAGIRSAATTL